MAIFLVSCYNSSTNTQTLRWVESSTYANLVNAPNSGEEILTITRLNEYTNVIDAGGTSCFPSTYVNGENQYNKVFRANTVNQVVSNLTALGSTLISSYKIPATYKTI